MDARHFDRLARSLTERGSRRGVVGLLAALPLAGGLGTLLSDDAEGKGRRKKRARRRKRRQDHERRQKQQQRQKRRDRKQTRKGPPPGGDNPDCQAEPIAITCEGKCGPFENTCGDTVDCGPCQAGLTCASCAAYRNGDEYDPDANCCGDDLVCDCLPLAYYPWQGYFVACKRSGVCRPNRAPAVLERNHTATVYNSSYQWGINLELTGYEADEEISEMRFRIVTQPTHGFVYIYETDRAFGPGTPAPPPPPIPEDAPMDCYPRCTQFAKGCSVDDYCKEGTPEGWYVSSYATYYPHVSTYEGPDSFTYSAVDIFGAESPPMPYYLTIIQGE